VISPFKSIRSKLTLWYSLVVLTTLVAFGLIAYTYFSRQLVENLDRSLSNEVRWVTNYIKPKAAKVKPSRKFAMKKKPARPNERQQQLPEPERPEMADADDEIWSQIYEHALINPRKTIIEVTDKKGAPIFRSFSTAEESLMVGEVALNTIKIITVRSENGQDLRVAATATESLDIYVAYPLGDLKEVLDNLFSIFLILIPIALGVSVGGGWLLAYKSLRPVDLITRTARRITAENLDQQIARRDVDDEIGRLVSTFNDMIARLRQSFDQIKQFSVDASHELRTPLTIMRGEVELALGSVKEPEEYRRVLVSNLEENLRLASIIDNLLTLSRADLGQFEVSFEKINLKELVDELYEDSEIIAMKKQIRITLLRNEDVSIMGDRIRLRQLFLNLIENAVKFTPEKGKVNLSLEQQNGIAKIQVSDTGIGIPKEQQGKIFDRFYRVEKGRSRDLGGSGLGLAIAKWVAELHKGTIEVESEPQQGTTFTVSLPLSPERNGRQQVPEEGR